MVIQKMHGQNESAADIGRLLEVLPPRVQSQLGPALDHDGLLEVVLDLGRPPAVRTTAGERDLAGA